MSVYWPYSGATDYGECWCTSIYDDQDQRIGIQVERADPRVLISAAVLRLFHDEMQFGSIACIGEGCPVGDVFTIDGINRRVVYVVRAPDPRWPRLRAYIAEWPD